MRSDTNTPKKSKQGKEGGSNTPVQLTSGVGSRDSSVEDIMHNCVHEEPLNSPTNKVKKEAPNSQDEGQRQLSKFRSNESVVLLAEASKEQGCLGDRLVVTPETPKPQSGKAAESESFGKLNLRMSLKLHSTTCTRPHSPVNVKTLLTLQKLASKFVAQNELANSHLEASRTAESLHLNPAKTSTSKLC